MPTHAIAPADLALLCRSLLRGIPLTPDEPACLVHVDLPEGTHVPIGPDTEIEVGMRPLDAHTHPVRAVVGLHAPEAWTAFGMVATATARPADDPSAARTGIRTAHLVARGGSWAAAMEPLGAPRGPVAEHLPDLCSGTDPDGVIPRGRIDDALRLALGLPTAPPATDTLELFTVQWLDSMVAEAARLSPAQRRGCTERWALAHHPAAAALGLDPVGGLPALLDEAPRLAAWRDWSQLRRLCAAGTWAHPDLRPHEAAWLDDGAFSRWALAAWPDLPLLRDTVWALLPPRTASLVDDALVSWNIMEDLDRP